MTQAIAGYAADADVLIPAWLKLDSAHTHAPVLHLLPAKPSRILDLGAGIGSDADWLAKLGHTVLAVEPTDGLRNAGIDLHAGPGIAWLDDRLPELSRVMARGERFDLVKLTAVWAHLDDEQRRKAMANISLLLEKGGRLILSIRDGWTPANRPVFDADVDATIAMAQSHGLSLIFRQQTDSIQALNRANGVTWHWLAFDA